MQTMPYQALLIFFFFCAPLIAQEQVDKADALGKASAAVDRLSFRVRVTKAEPEQKTVRIHWRRGGEGLGGTVVRGEWIASDKSPQIPLEAWTEWLAMKDVVGNARGWEYPSIVVMSEPVTQQGRSPKPGVPLTDIVVDFEFAESGKIFKQFTEIAPKGATVGFAFPGSMLGDKITPEFIAMLNGISMHARLRREQLEKAFPNPAPMPKLFGIIGKIGGYGEGPTGLRGSYGFGVRHCNPAILIDEFRVLSMLGVNGMVDSVHLADAASVGSQFRRIYWGGPGSGDPMAFFQKPGKAVEMPEGCPFDPALRPYVAMRVEKAIEEHLAVAAKESWALWDDEMGVYAKDHIARCVRCASVFRD